MRTQISGKPLCRFPYTHQGKTLYYDITSDSTVKVTYYSSVATFNNYVNGDVIIPSFVEYNGTMYSVTSIGERAFRDCSGLTSVTIPNSVTSIGERAFYNCSGLTTLNFNAINCQDFEAYCDNYDYYDSYCDNYDYYDYYYPFSGTSLTTVNIGDSVQRIPANFVRNCSGLTSVTIPNSVASIGESAFSGCSGLTSVTIGNSLTSIGESAFFGCSGLTSVTIPNSVTSIGSSAFSGCSGLTSINVASGNTHYSSIDGVLYNYVQDTLMQCPGAKTSVTIPNSVTSIGGSAFEDCSGLTSVTIPNSVTSIGYSAFSGCSGLTSVSIPNSVTSIGNSAFRGCSSLTSVTIPNSLTSIGKRAFSGCSGLTTLNFNAINCQDFDYAYAPFIGTSLTTVNIGDSVQRIPAYFVSGCSGLTSVTIPNSVTSIGEGAFRDCSGLTSITVPNSVTSIRCDAFRDCSSLTTLNFNAIDCQYFEALIDDDNYYFPFSGTSLTTVKIGDSVQRIPANFVPYCSGLTSVTIPNSVTSIGGWAFCGCSGLTSVTIPNSVTSIGERAFCGCSGLTSVIIPNSVTSIGDRAFSGCSDLTSINVASGNTHYSSIDGVLYNSVQDTLIQCPGAKTSVTIPNSVTSIGDRAFSGCSGLTTLNFNAINCQNFESYRYNGNYYFPFSGTSLTTVNIGDSVQRIPANFVSGCSSLTSVTIGNSVTSIGEWAFSDCSGLTTLNFNAINCQDFGSFGTSLTTVNIGDSVRRIPAYFVSGCSSLTSVTIGNSVTSIGSSAFEGCSDLTSVTIPNSVTSIGVRAFYDCSGLTSVTIPNSVTSIEDYAFYGCRGLTSVTIPNSVTSIGKSAFFHCSGLTSVRCLSSVPPSIGSSSFSSIPSTCTLTVPCGNLEAYTASDWNTYFAAHIIEEPLFELSVSANDEAYGRVEVENHSCESKTLTAIANNGYVFSRWNDGNTENPRTVTITSDTTFMAIFTASGSSSLQEVNTREFALYPNPAKSFVNLEFETLEENTLLQILDINGRRVRTLELKAGVETLRIDLGDLPKGVYTVMLGNTTKKLIVE